ncbi:hypothetical protein MD484_g7800, partial [Candolleomyces efflorescens]
MPQPKKHRSVKARVAANREKAKKSYEKYILQLLLLHNAQRNPLCRHKDDINDRRRKLYRKQHPLHEEPVPRASIAATPAPDPGLFWIKISRKVPARLRAIIGACPKRYTQGAYCEWVGGYDDPKGSLERLQGRRDELTPVERSASKAADQIYQLYGVDDNFKAAQEIAGNVRQVLQWMDEIVILAEVDPGTLIKDHRAGRLGFQCS